MLSKIFTQLQRGLMGNSSLISMLLVIPLLLPTAVLAQSTAVDGDALISSEVVFPTPSINADLSQLVATLNSRSAAEIEAAIDQLEQSADFAALSPFLHGKLWTVRLDNGIDQAGEIPSSMIDALNDFIQSEKDNPYWRSIYRQALREYIAVEDWANVAAIYRRGLTDTEECALKRHYIENLNTPEQALAGYQRFWRKGYRIPAICDPVTALWQAQGGLVQADWQAKYHEAIRVGNIAYAREVIQQIESPARTDLQRWIDVSINPARAIQNYESWQYPEDNDLAIYALRLLINQDSVANKTLFDAVWAHAGRPVTNAWQQLRARLILYLLSRNDRTAISRLYELPEQYWTDEHKQWLLRLMLKSNNTTGYEAFLDQQSDEFKADWLRSYEQVQLAPIRYHQTRYNAVFEHLELALALREQGHPRFAKAIWQETVKSFDKPQLEQAVILAQAFDWHEMMIRTAADTGHWQMYDALYPSHAAVDTDDVYAKYILAIIREESLFAIKARSSANAYGLMQLLPTTAQIFDPNISATDLYDPNLNVVIGTRYFKRLVERFGEVEKAIAAYNAGPTIVSTWYPDITDMAVWIRLIPYKETRGYVAKVLDSADKYQQIYNLP